MTEPASEANDTQADSGDFPLTGWQVAGILLMTVGLVVIIIGYIADAGVATPGLSEIGVEAVANVSRLATKLMTVIVGCTFVLAGAVFAARPR